MKPSYQKVTAASLGAIPLLLGGCLFQSNSSTSSAPKQVTILGTLTGVAEEKLEAALVPFTEATGIEVVYEGTDAFTTLIPVRVDSNNTPDIALFPQPGLMVDFIDEGHLIPLDGFIPVSQLQQAYSDYWLDLVSRNDRPYGVWIRASIKSLVWYNPTAFAEADYAPPTSWNELETLSEQIIADGGTPWCIGMESGKATGWVGTDWVEEILLRMSGPEVYDQWVSHKIPFDAPEVKAAFETFGRLVQTQGNVFGGPTGVISTPFGDSPRPLFEQPPGCYLHRQANFIREFFPETAIPGDTVDVFPLPPMDSGPPPILVSGIVFGMFNDTPEAKALMEYLATPKPHKIWASLGSYISPHQQVPLTAYNDPLTRQQAEILQNAEVIRFDGSDLMPGAVGTGTFWSGVVDYVGGKPLDQVLADIEASWPAEAQ